MELKKENVKRDTASCNFCQKGELNIYQNGLVYPYEDVVTFSRGKGGGLCACICEECLDELYKKAKIEFGNAPPSIGCVHNTLKYIGPFYSCETCGTHFNARAETSPEKDSPF